jgi:methylglutaconyl-CoA hydratase
MRFSTEFNFVDYEVKDRIAYITLNRPEKRNALNYDYVTELKTAFSYAENDNKAKIIVLKANGKAFSAGADLAYLQQLQSNTYEENLLDSNHLMELFKQIYTHPKVVIAQIEGHAIAGGSGLAAVCDYSYAVPDAKFGYTEVRIGFVPAIVMVFLLRKIGEVGAKELLLSGRLISAREAKSYGMINRVSEADKIQDDVYQLAQELIEKNSGESMRRTKQMIAKVQEMALNEGLDFAAKMNAETRDTKDCKKGIGSFLGKKDLVW